MKSYCLIGGGDKLPIISRALEFIDQPNVLIISDACTKPETYQKKVPSIVKLFEELGVPSVTLNEFGATPTELELSDRFGSANVLYTVGGHTPTLIDKIKTAGKAEKIMAASAEGKMLMGTSAGALLPFERGQINPAKNPNLDEWDYEIIPLLGMIRAIGVVHANKIDPSQSVNRLDSFLASAGIELTNDQKGISLDEGAGLITNAEGGELVFSSDDARVSLIERENGLLQATRVDNFEDLTESASGIFD
jgi:cyanophycinase-like exopeptidase